MNECEWLRVVGDMESWATIHKSLAMTGGGGVRADLTAWGEYVVWHFLEWNRFISCIFQSEHGVSHCLHSKNFTSTVSNYLSWLAGKTQSWRFPSLNTMKLGSESMLLASVCKVCSSVSLSRCTYSKKNHLRNAPYTLWHTHVLLFHTLLQIACSSVGCDSTNR